MPSGTGRKKAREVGEKLPGSAKNSGILQPLVRPRHSFQLPRQAPLRAIPRGRPYHPRNDSRHQGTRQDVPPFIVSPRGRQGGTYSQVSGGHRTARHWCASNQIFTQYANLLTDLFSRKTCPPKAPACTADFSPEVVLLYDDHKILHFFRYIIDRWTPASIFFLPSNSFSKGFLDSRNPQARPATT